MTRPRGIGRGRGEGSKATQFRGGKGQGQARRRERGAEREAGGASAHPPRNTQNRGSGKATGTPRSVAAGAGMACEGCEEERAERGLDRLRSELAGERAVSARQSVKWSLALAILRRHPDAYRAVLDGVFGAAESPEPTGRGLLAGRGTGPAGAVLAGPPGGAASPPRGEEEAPGPAAGGDSPEGRGRRTIYNGIRHVPVPDAWGGTIETGTPRRRGVGGIPSYGDEGPLTSRD